MNTAISLQWCQTEFIDCWQSAFSLKIHRFLIPATAFARARWRVMSFFKTLKLGRLIANQIREFCPKTVTLLIRRLPPKFFMCGLGKLCPSVYIVKTGQFSDLFRKPVKNICVLYPSHFFWQNLVMTRLPEAKSCFLGQSTGNAPRPKELIRLLNAASIFCSHESPRVLLLLSRRAHRLIQSTLS